MAVTACYYSHDVIEAEADEHDLGTYTVGFDVYTNSVMGPQKVVQGAISYTPDAGEVNIPPLWTAYSYNGDSDAISWLRKFSVRRDPDSLYKWHVTAHYMPVSPGEGSQDVGGDPIGSVANPVDRAPVIWWDREVNTVLKLKDKDGKAIRNRANDYYERDIEHEHPRGVLVVEKNVSTLGEVHLLQRKFDNAVNQSAWLIGGESVPQRAALCREVSSGPPQTEQGYTFFAVVFRFVFAEEGQNWDEPMREAGTFWYVKDAQGNYKTSVDAAGRAFRQVDSKDGKLYALAEDGTRKLDPEDVDIKFWRVRREVNFNDLPF